MTYLLNAKQTYELNETQRREYSLYVLELAQWQLGQEMDAHLAEFASEDNAPQMPAWLENRQEELFAQELEELEQERYEEALAHRATQQFQMDLGSFDV